jgi:hypothetical protein
MYIMSIVPRETSLAETIHVRYIYIWFSIGVATLPQTHVAAKSKATLSPTSRFLHVHIRSPS